SPSPPQPSPTRRSSDLEAGLALRRLAAEDDVHAAARHVRGDGDRALAARFGDDLGFSLVILRVQDGVVDAVFERGGQVIEAALRSEEHTSELQSPYDLV